MWQFKIKQDRQCTYNVTFRRVHETTAGMEKEYLRISVCARARARVCGCTGKGVFERM